METEGPSTSISGHPPPHGGFHTLFHGNSWLLWEIPKVRGTGLAVHRLFLLFPSIPSRLGPSPEDQGCSNAQDRVLHLFENYVLSEDGQGDVETWETSVSE